MRHILLIFLLVASAQAVAAKTSEAYLQCEQAALGEYDFLACMQSEIKRQDDRLNKNYRAAMQAIETFRQRDLTKIQRIWIKYRDAKCGFFYHKHSGSGGLLDAEECRMEETIRRADELESIY
jgi:uncharacterized protein YecT (DUF1311 family)